MPSRGTSTVQWGLVNCSNSDRKGREGGRWQEESRHDQALGTSLPARLTTTVLAVTVSTTPTVQRDPGRFPPQCRWIPGDSPYGVDGFQEIPPRCRRIPGDSPYGTDGFWEIQTWSQNTLELSASFLLLTDFRGNIFPLKLATPNIANHD